MLTDRTFKHAKLFDAQWEELGCDDDDLSELQMQGIGKSGGARVLYGDFPEHGVVYLFAAYPKRAKRKT